MTDTTSTQAQGPAAKAVKSLAAELRHAIIKGGGWAGPLGAKVTHLEEIALAALAQQAQVAAEPAAKIVEASLLGLTGHAVQMLASASDFPIGTKLYAQPPQPEAQALLFKLAAIAAECSDPDTTHALDKLIEAQPAAAPAGAVAELSEEPKLLMKRAEWESLSPEAQAKLRSVVWKGADEYRRRQALGRERLANAVLAAAPAPAAAVVMQRNEDYAGQPGWKLHRCTDGEQCRAPIPGGCALGYCTHAGVTPESAPAPAAAGQSEADAVHALMAILERAGEGATVATVIAKLEAAQQPAPSAEAGREVQDKALDLLATLFDAYENGVDCYEDPDEQAGYVGKAIKLDNKTFQDCCDVLNQWRPVNAAPTTASAGGDK
jgi:hypothetical protein